MKVEIIIECDNAAFEETPGFEVARILEKLAKDVRAYQQLNNEMDPGRTLRDANGNTVGSMGVYE